MKYFFGTRIFLVFATLYVVNLLHAQHKVDDTLQYLAGRFTTGETPYNAKQFYYLAYSSASHSLPAHFRVVKPFHRRAAIVSIPDHHTYEQMARQVILLPANDLWKCTEDVLTLMTKPRHTPVAFVLGSSNIEALLTRLRQLKLAGTVIHTDYPSATIVLNCTPAVFTEKLLPLPEVIYAALSQKATIEANIIGYNRSFHGLSALDFKEPTANGRNIVVGIKEQKMEATDLDLVKRVLPSRLAASTISQHATIIASIVGGAGNLFYTGRGVANQCNFFPSSFSNLFPDNLGELQASNVSVQNHSYGTIIEQFYGAEALSYDAQCYANPTIAHVFSAGNRGTLAAREGKYANLEGFANLTGNFKMAKNVITVGSVSNTGAIQVESSSGPTYDGRLAPQLTALGPNGTSDAAAIVSGTIAVLQQVYSDSHSGNMPAASLVKAILFNTADDIGNMGVDFKTGYGLLNALHAVRAMKQNNFLGGTLTPTTPIFETTLDVPANTTQLKLTLAWTDPPASIANLTALNNNLDITLISPNNATIHHPWILDTHPAIEDLKKEATTGIDSINTSEQIVLQYPDSGKYTIRITARKLTTNEQLFYVATNLKVGPSFEFVNPVHTSDINRFENPLLAIAWECALLDSATTANLAISFDNGSSWTPLAKEIKLNQRSFLWEIKDTVCFGKLRMETPFGRFFSEPFVISPPLPLTVAFNCTDSIQITWPKQQYASSYKIFNAVDSPYLKHVTTLSDTSFSFSPKKYYSTVFAIEPIASNGIPAARSTAIDVRTQGVNCFYKSFYYTLLESNRLLIHLELSDWQQVDTVFFEEVNKNGTYVQTFGSLGIQKNNFIYLWQQNNLNSGTTYFRARIRLKNKTDVFTSISYVITSGSENIIVYPNPANRNSELYIKIMQGVPIESSLQILDAYGTIQKTVEANNNSIMLQGLMHGIYFFRLVHPNGKLLQTGKLIIH